MYYLLPPRRDVCDRLDLNPNSIYQQQELHVLVTAALFYGLNNYL